MPGYPRRAVRLKPAVRDGWASGWARQFVDEEPEPDATYEPSEIEETRTAERTLRRAALDLLRHHRLMRRYGGAFIVCGLLSIAPHMGWMLWVGLGCAAISLYHWYRFGSQSLIT